MKILYIGGFEMPDKNAAAQRVLSMAKAMREHGHDISFLGITKSRINSGEVDSFAFEAVDYPNSTKAWIKYAAGCGVLDYISKAAPAVVILYNYPALAQERIIRHCHQSGIKVLGDITEWYDSKGLIKRVDTFVRMCYSNRRLDGVIAISRYLADYYRECKIICVPPMVDISESKWKNAETEELMGRIKLIYVGRPGTGKDRLDYIINGIIASGAGKYKLDIVGINEAEYNSIYGSVPNIDSLLVVFHGMLPHKDAVALLKKSDFQIFFRNPVRVNNAGFPTKFVESISAGVPVITNKISNISDYVHDRNNSFIIDEPTEFAIKEVLQYIASLPADTYRDIKANLQTDMFDYHHYSDAINDFILSLWR